MNMENNLNEELNKRSKATFAAFRPLNDATDQIVDAKLRANPLNSTVPQLYVM